MPDGHKNGLIFEEGKAAHLRHNASLQKNFDLISPLAIAAIRAPAFAAVGGIIASLGYDILNHTRPGAGAGQVEVAVFWFLVAIFLSVLAPGLSYVGQYARAQAIAEQDLDFTDPFVHNNRSSRLLGRLGQVCRTASIAAILGAYAALLFGGGMFLRLLS